MNPPQPPDPQVPSRESGLNTSFFTFGYGHTHGLGNEFFNVDRCVKIVTRHDPRDVMNALFDNKWAAQYDDQPEEQWIPDGVFTIGDDMLDSFGIDPLTLKKNPS